MIDLHSHVLPGLDDGVASLDDALALAAASVAEGTVLLAATPHVRDDFPTTPEQMETAIERVREAVRERGIPLEIVPGGEVSLERVAGTPIEVLRRFGLAGSRGYLLVEFPYVGWPSDLARSLERLLDEGIRPVLAHPERNPEVQAAPARLAPLVELGVIVQVTAASISGDLGRAARSTAEDLVRSGLAQLLASDAHGVGRRGVGLARARKLIRGGAMRRWLTEDVPGAIATDSALPPRPSTRRMMRRI